MGAIKCFGDFWNRDLISWSPGAAGIELPGRRRRSRTSKVNFRHQIGVYVLFTADREIVYVGQTGSGERASLFGRLRRHRYGRLRDRWTHFSWFGLKGVRDNGELEDYRKANVEKNTVLDELEAVIIHLAEPRLNRQGPRWGGAVEYIQWDGKDTRLDDSDEIEDED